MTDPLSDVKKALDVLWDLHEIAGGYSGYRRTYRLSCQYADAGGMSEEKADAILTLRDAAPSLIATIEEQRQVIAEYGRVRQYVRHLDLCSVAITLRAGGGVDVGDCDCGLSAALKGAP